MAGSNVNLLVRYLFLEISSHRSTNFVGRIEVQGRVAPVLHKLYPLFCPVFFDVAMALPSPSHLCGLSQRDVEEDPSNHVYRNQYILIMKRRDLSTLIQSGPFAFLM